MWRRVPFLYEDAFQWYTSFDPLGELLDRPDPSPALELLSKVINILITKFSWATAQIHIFGFAQGGSVALEFLLKDWKKELSAMSKALPANDNTSATTAPRHFGSVVSVSGPFLSYPTVSAKCPTPVFLFHRSPPAETALPAGALGDFNKAFEAAEEVCLGGDGMPRNRDEWYPIMKFWSEKLKKRQADGLYEVMSGLGT
jgi:hypothetical protein